MNDVHRSANLWGWVGVLVFSFFFLFAVYVGVVTVVPGKHPLPPSYSCQSYDDTAPDYCIPHDGYDWQKEPIQ